MLKKSSFIAAAVLVAAAALHADNIVDEIIARVNDQIITRAELEKAKSQAQDELKQQFPNDWQAKWNEDQKDVLRGLVDRQLLLEKGKEVGITGETEVVKRLNQLRQQMNLASIDDLEKEAQKQGVSFEDFKETIRTRVVTEQVIGQEVGSHIHITNDDILEWYNKHQKDLEGQEEIGLSEIMVSVPAPKPAAENKDNPSAGQPEEDPAKVAEAETKAKQLLDQVRQGAKFEDVAKKNSEGPTAAQGGTLGNFKRGERSEER